MTASCCPAGHEQARSDRACRACRRDQVISQVAAADRSLPAAQIAAAVDAVARSPQALRDLAAALSADPRALACGAPPVAGRLAAELIARGAALAVPSCAACGRAGYPLTRTQDGGMCKRCAYRRLAVACARCGVVKPVAARDASGEPACERCRRQTQGMRPCGTCGVTAPIAVRARDGRPDVCVNCYRMPAAACSGCGRHRECNFAGSGRPVCTSCSPRATVPCARCGHDRPAQARWPEGPVCDPCYRTALRHRGQCAACGQARRLVFPPGTGADICAGCAGIPVICACNDCGTEDKLYEKGRCDRCSLRRRAAGLLSAGTGQAPAGLTSVLEAICSARTPRSALNWLRQGAAAAILADLASGKLPATHEALDAHPHPRAAGYLRHILTAGGALPSRDEDLARTQQWLAALLASIEMPEHRRVVQAFATWQVMLRLRRRSEASTRPRTPTAHARLQISTAVRFLAWQAARGRSLPACRQADVEDWLATGPGACLVRAFLTWAADRGHCPAFTVPAPPRATGNATSPQQRRALVSRLLHDDTLEVTDRVAGCLLLLFGQQQSRIAAMTTDQLTCRDDAVYLRLSQHELPVPQPLGVLLLQLASDGKTHVGVGTPAGTRWLFPGGTPGHPITASRLAERLRALGIPSQAGRRAALIDLAAQIPAAVLADLLGLHPTTATHWISQAGGDWSRYAAELARDRHHQP